jgi:hypothetical protein
LPSEKARTESKKFILLRFSQSPNDSSPQGCVVDLNRGSVFSFAIVLYQFVSRLPVRICLDSAILCISRSASQNLSARTVGDIRPLSRAPLLSLSQLVEGIDRTTLGTSVAQLDQDLSPIRTKPSVRWGRKAGTRNCQHLITGYDEEKTWLLDGKTGE